MQITMCNCFCFVYSFCLRVQSKCFFSLSVTKIIKNWIKLMESHHKPSWWNMPQLQNAVCFIGLIKLVTFLVKLMTDRDETQTSAEKSEVTWQRAGAMSKILSFIVSDVCSDMFDMPVSHLFSSKSSCTLMRQNTFNFQPFLYSSHQSKKTSGNMKVYFPPSWTKSLNFTVLTETSKRVINAKVNSYQIRLSAIGMLPIEVFIYFTLVST